MLPRTLPALGLLVFLVSLVLPFAADAQVFVYPRRPSQTNVQYHPFSWREIDLLVGPRASGEEIWQAGPRYHTQATWRARQNAYAQSTAAPHAHAQVLPSDNDAPAPDAIEDWSGGVRMYFYDEERPVAEWAAAYTTHSYRRMVDLFDYVPRQTVPFFLYSSYKEFLQTNLFPIQEGVLGVTSPRDLKMTQPYFGDHRQFRDVFDHELAHQFMIQKVRTVAEESEALGNPLERFPLWFIEGSAEFYNKGGVDPEADALVRDAVLNPDPRRGYMLPGFFADQPRGYLTTYKYGQLRCAFLEEVYGDGMVRRIMEESPRLTGTQDNPNRLADFPALIEAMTGDSPQRIGDRFDAWLKARAFGVYEASAQRPADFDRLEKTAGYVLSMRASEDGAVMVYRNIDQLAGRIELNFVHYLAPDDPQRIVADRQPGVESLHPLAGRNFDITHDAIAWAAQAGAHDVLYIQRFASQLVKRPVAQSDEAQAVLETTTRWRTDLDFEERWAYDLGAHDIVSVESLAFEPGGGRIALIGQRRAGHRDLFLVTPRDHQSFDIKALTDDIWAEREVDWGPRGVVYNSDATDHGFYNLFQVDPDSGDTERISVEARDHQSPSFIQDGRLMVTVFDRYGGNLYELVPGDDSSRLVARTQTATMMRDAAPGPDRDLWALYYFQGRHVPTRVPSLTPIDADLAPSSTGAPTYTVDSMDLGQSEPYNALASKNWELGNLFGIFGASTQGFAGQLFASAYDRLRNHALYLSLYAAGDIRTTDGYLFYTNQAQRLIWGAGLFQEVGYRLDDSFADQIDDGDSILQAERFYGASGTLRWPFDRYRHVQGEVSVGGVDYFLFDSTRNYLQDGELNGSGEDLYDDWQASNEGTFLQTEASVGLGLNSLRYHPATGPVAGSSGLLEARASWQPGEQALLGSVRLDAEHYFQIYDRFHLLTRVGAGHSLGSRRARQFFLSSFDTLRSVQYGDPDFLIGRNFAFTTAEFQFPLNWLVRVAFLDLEGIFGADFGGVGDSPEQGWERRVFNLTTGLNIGFSWLAFRLHFAKPFDIGAVKTPNNGRWQTNFSIGYRYQ